MIRIEKRLSVNIIMTKCKRAFKKKDALYKKENVHFSGNFVTKAIYYNLF